MEALAVGIDIGGTSVKIGLFDRSLELVHRCETIASCELVSGDELVAQSLESVKAGAAKMKGGMEDIAGIGIGSPGPLDYNTGIILNTPNIRILRDYPLRDGMKQAAGCPVCVDNDANVYVLGEARRGAGRGYPIVLGVTLGTGFGWGIVFDGRVYHGATGTAAEYGLSVWREEGHTWEEEISIRGLMRKFRDLEGKAESPEEVHQLAGDGDKAALAAWTEYGRMLGLALSHGVNMLDPHVVVVGGAMAGAWEHFSQSMMEALHRNIFEPPRVNLKVVPSELGGLAALYGAASQVEFEGA
ncbi:ROK family protein [Candidatus Neomarinimicrobiota bacterium]